MECIMSNLKWVKNRSLHYTGACHANKYLFSLPLSVAMDTWKRCVLAHGWKAHSRMARDHPFALIETPRENTCPHLQAPQLPESFRRREKFYSSPASSLCVGDCQSSDNKWFICSWTISAIQLSALERNLGYFNAFLRLAVSLRNTWNVCIRAFRWLPNSEQELFPFNEEHWERFGKLSCLHDLKVKNKSVHIDEARPIPCVNCKGWSATWYQRFEKIRKRAMSKVRNR